MAYANFDRLQRKRDSARFMTDGLETFQGGPPGHVARKHDMRKNDG
jgi:hypothetical protein